MKNVLNMLSRKIPNEYDVVKVFQIQFHYSFTLKNKKHQNLKNHKIHPFEKQTYVTCH